MWLTGIDEAGYGPILGPLVVTAVTFEAPDGDRPVDLWAALWPAVARPGERRAGRLVVGDSKLVFSQARGLAPLELGCLAFAQQLADTFPPDLFSLLESFGIKRGAILADGPWYDGVRLRLPLACDPDELSARTAMLTQAMALCELRLRAIRCALLLPSPFNRLVAQTANKADALFALCSGLLEQVLQQSGSHRVSIDKHGGRRYYASMLLASGLKISSHREGRLASSYALELTCGTGRLEFLQNGERHRFQIALASMFSKYVREALMAPFNRYWQARVPGLKATAGYATDGARFLRDIEPVRQREGVDLERLRRQR